MQVNKNELSNCTSCLNGYKLVYIREQNRFLCKLEYEIEHDLYKKYSNDIYQENNIFEIKMIYPQIQNTNVSVKNEKTIFYFEFLFDLYGYHCYQNNLCLEERYIINNIYHIQI